MKNTININKNFEYFTRVVFGLAALYNISWFLFFQTNSSYFQSYYTFPIRDYALIFSLLNVIVLTFALGYIYAAFKPNKFWLLAPISFFAKSLGIVLAFLLVKTQLAYPSFYWQVLFNDIIWLPPLGVISYQYFKAWQDTTEGEAYTFQEAMQQFKTQEGKTLKQWQNTQPVLLVFLRHFGCTFCKEALGDLAQQRTSIENIQGVKLIFVHMAEEGYAKNYFSDYGLEDAPRISDPTCVLYETFNLKRASFKQVFGWGSWWRGAKAFFGKGHGVGKLVGDGFRMPGVFVLSKGEILQSFKHQTASDLPPYQELASCPIT